MNIQYKKIKIYEYKKDKYGEYSFSDKVNIFRSSPDISVDKENKIGKSSIMKSIMYCMGLESKQWDSKFPYKEMIFSMDITINEELLTIARLNDKFVINEKILSISEFRDELAGLLKIELLLNTKNSTKKIKPYPQDYLMFYYVDQDTSWNNKLFTSVNSNYAKYESGVAANLLNYILDIDDEKMVQLRMEKKKIVENKKVVQKEIDSIVFTENLVVSENHKEFPSITEEEFINELKFFETKLVDLFSKENKYKQKLYDNSLKINNNEQELNELEALYTQLDKEKDTISKLHCKYCDSELTTNNIIKKYKIYSNKVTVAELHHKKQNQLKELFENRELLNSEMTEIKNDISLFEKELNTKVDLFKISQFIDLKVEKQKIHDFDKIKEDKNIEYAKTEQALKSKNKDIREYEKHLQKRKDTITTRFSKIIAALDTYLKEDDNVEKYSKYGTLQIKETGTTSNLVLASMFIAYFNLLDEYAKIKIPFMIDTVIKDDHDQGNLNILSKIINDFYFSLNSQTFYSYVDNDKFLIDEDKNDIDYIYIGKRVCNKDFSNNEKTYVENIVKMLMAKDDN